MNWTRLLYDYEVVGEEVVEAACLEVAAFGPSEAERYMSRIGRRQPELLGFVTTMTEHLSLPAQETAIYAFTVVYRMFERASGTSLPKAGRRRIVAAYEKISDELDRLLTADDRFVERHALVSTSGEPFVVRYVSEVLLEPDDPEAKIPDEEVGEVFMCLKTVIDVLHDTSASG